MKLKDALKRIEELEKRVCELEARPLLPAREEYHYHYHWPQPTYWPVFPAPVYPQPWWGAPTYTLGAGTCVETHAASVLAAGTSFNASYGPEH